MLEPWAEISQRLRRYFKLRNDPFLVVPQFELVAPQFELVVPQFELVVP
jgi:hypothetical protein